MILYFLIQSLLTFVIFMTWITLGTFSGGEVGMTPLTVLITITIQFTLGSLIYIYIKKRTTSNLLITLFLYMVLYEIIFYFFTGSFALGNITNEGFSGAIYRAYSFSSLIAGIILFTFLYFNKKV